jgi:hypothetical protein
MPKYERFDKIEAITKGMSGEALRLIHKIPAPEELHSKIELNEYVLRWFVG